MFMILSCEEVDKLISFSVSQNWKRKIGETWNWDGRRAVLSNIKLVCDQPLITSVPDTDGWVSPWNEKILDPAIQLVSIYIINNEKSELC